MALDWTSLDTAIVLTAGAAAMSCALPGAWLVLRKHSMLGDALAHSALPGVVGAFLVAYQLQASGWLWADQREAALHWLFVLGAVVVGVGTAWLTEWVQRLGRLESGAALGVVFTSLFALGLVGLRLAADDVHIDPDCFLFGVIETASLDLIPGTAVPWPAVLNGSILLFNLLLTWACFKELQVSAFDPDLAASLGLPARGIHYGLMSATALTVVAAFESVGSILVVGLLIVPAATALLLTERLPRVLAWSLALAGLCAVLGHVLARTIPPLVFQPLGFETVEDAGTAGMMTATSGLLFVAVWFLAPRHGLIARGIHRLRLAVRVAGDDILGLMYRMEERPSPEATRISVPQLVARQQGLGRGLTWVALQRLRRKGLIRAALPGEASWRLTDRGREAARSLVRAHRLWEAYMAKHFQLQDDHFHETADRVEHVLDHSLQDRLQHELNRPSHDPHGSEIPEAPSAPR
jgi:manganese/zinc/iron transport system permease protein